MAGRWKRSLQFLLGFGLAALLLWAFFKGTDWAGAWAAASGAVPWLIGATVVANIASLALRAARWHVLLAGLKPDVPLERAWRFFIVGFGLSCVVPGRLGEILRPYLLAKDQGLGFAPTFATVVTDRMMDLIAALCVVGSAFVLPSALGPRTGDPEVAAHIAFLEAFGLGALVVAAAAVAFLFVIRVRKTWALGIVQAVARVLPARARGWVVNVAEAFADGLAALCASRLVAAVAATVCVWGVLGAATWTGLAAFGIVVPFHHAEFLLGVLSLGVALPTPAGSGTYHAAAIVVVGQLWGVSLTRPESVAAYAIVTHVLAYGPIVVLSAYYLLRHGIRVFSVAEQAHRERDSLA